MSFGNPTGFRESKKKLTSKTPIERFNVVYCIKKGYFNLVRYLLNIGADPNTRDQDKNGLKRFGLIYCTFIEDENWALNIAQNLLECGAYLSLKDVNGLTALHYCSAFGLTKLLRLFLDSLDFDLTKVVDKQGNTVLHYAVKSQNVSCVNILLDKCQKSHIDGLDQMKNNNGATALEYLLSHSSNRVMSTSFTSQNEFFVFEISKLDINNNTANNKLKQLDTNKINNKSSFFQTELNLENYSSDLNQSYISQSQSTIGDENKYSFFVNSYEIKRTTSAADKEAKKEQQLGSVIDSNIRLRRTGENKLVINKELRNSKLIKYNSTFFKKEYLFKDLKFGSSVEELIQKKLNPIYDNNNNTNDVKKDTNDGLVSTTATTKTTTSVKDSETIEEPTDWKSKIPNLFSELENSLTSSFRLTSEKKKPLKAKKIKKRKRSSIISKRANL